MRGEASHMKRVFKAKVRWQDKTGAFDVFNVIFMALFCFTILYPFLYLTKQSLSSGFGIPTLSLIPDNFSLLSYGKVFANEYIKNGFVNTISRTVFGTPLTLFVTLMAAYALSKPYFPHKTFYTGIFVFTMFFDGGLIPNFLLVKNLGLTDTIFALILPRMINTFTLIIVRNYFASLPGGLEEAARIDGAGDFSIFARIFLPLSVPIIATVALWTIVDHWNWWFDCLIYIQSPGKMVLQVILRRIVLEGTMQMMDLSGFNDSTSVNPDNIKAATVLVATIPIILVYPFLQKYFIKGILVGSLKG